MRIAFAYEPKLWQRLDDAHQLRRAGLAVPFSLSRLRAAEAKVVVTTYGRTDGTETTAIANTAMLRCLIRIMPPPCIGSCIITPPLTIPARLSD